MISKAEVIKKHLNGLTVLDIGGSGYGDKNPYEKELVESWKVCLKRIKVDYQNNSDIVIDFNKFPLPILSEKYDIAVAFDVLEHLENPVSILRWIDCDKLIVTLPNSRSWFARRMERKNKSKHLYSFTDYTAKTLLKEGGWRVTKLEYQFGKWSFLSKVINKIGSLFPCLVGTGIVLYCDKE